MSKSWSDGMKALKDTFKFGDLCEIFDLKSPDNLDFDGDFGYAYYYHDALAKAEREGMDNPEEYAEEKAMEAEQEERDAQYTKYKDGCAHVIDEIAANFHLEFVPMKTNAWTYKVTPVKDWRDAAKEIRECVNGYGPWYFTSVKEFLDSGPYTARQAVLSHLHWMARYGEVYGGGSPQQQLARYLRY